MLPEDELWMSRALDLARKGLGRVSPNPACGAVVVAGEPGECVGEGFHEEFGGPHAEVVALRAAGGKAKGATLYVTLEPCRHEGKTPPCTGAVAQAGVARVVYAVADPHPEAAGGADVLRGMGIEVAKLSPEDSPAARDGRELYGYFHKHVRRNESFVLAKWAMTADGHLATRTGDSRWVTSEESRARGRLLRAESDALLVGVGTVLRDDPRLSARTRDGREALRVIVDSSLRTPSEAELFSCAGRGVLIACAEDAPAEREKALAGRGAEVLRLPAPGGRVSLESLLENLHGRGKLRLMMEGGGTLLGAAFDAKRVDYACVFIAPKVVGGRQAPGAVQGRGLTRMAEALEIADARWEPIGREMLLHGRVGDWDWMD
jgi:diaminohydroxyphosphoribosylaminopyrimidine deaminase/5-amino-6-(5-phosphoribosylamino)uracil reductase